MQKKSASSSLNEDRTLITGTGMRAFSILLLALLAGVFVGGCQTSPEILHDNPAFSVTVPEGWKSERVREPTRSRDFREMAIFKQGATALAMVSFYWFDEELDLQSTIARGMGMIEDKRFFKASFGDVVDGSYGQYEGLKAQSNERKLGLELQIEIYCFHANGKTFVVWVGDEVEDLDVHAEGFQIIEDSFSVR